jgi:hypothetical protein
VVCDMCNMTPIVGPRYKSLKWVIFPHKTVSAPACLCSSNFWVYLWDQDISHFQWCLTHWLMVTWYWHPWVR